MDKQTTAAFILIGVILVVWLYINAPDPQVTKPLKSVDSTQIDNTSSLEKPVEKKKNIFDNNSYSQKIKNSENLSSSDAKEKIITIETDLVKLELTSKGARIRKYYLKKYNTWYQDKYDESDFYNTHVQLINNKDGGDFNLVFVTKEGKLVNTAVADFNSDANNYYYKISGNETVSINYEFTLAGDQKIKKNFKFYGDNYQSDIDVELVNLNNIISSYRYDVVWSNGINFVEHNSVDEANYANASAFTGGEQVIIDAPGDGEIEKKDFNGKVDWVGVKNKYFAAIIAPIKPSEDGGALIEGATVLDKDLGTREYYTTSLKIPFTDKTYQKNSFHLYLGPINYDILKSYDTNFEALFDFGSFFGLKFIIRPISEYILLPFFVFLHGFIPNYGIVIIVFSIIIKFALYPLTKQSMLSMKKMQLLQPKIKELKEKHEGDQQKVQKETMKLYSTYGINPAGGCLPMLLQMPILIALYSLFNVTIEIRNEPFMLWITNLAAPDVLYVLPFKIPLLGVDTITGLAPLMGITMFFQQKMTMKDPSQKAMVYMMPVMLTAMFMSFPSGLNLYYFMFNLISIIQQQYINKKKGDNELVPVKNPKKKAGFMQRMMDAAEKQQQAKNQPAKKKKKF